MIALVLNLAERMSGEILSPPVSRADVVAAVPAGMFSRCGGGLPDFQRSAKQRTTRTPVPRHPSDPGQLRDVNNAARPPMVRRTSPLSPALHPDQRRVADPGGALVRLPSDKQIKRGTQGSTRAPEDTLREYLDQSGRQHRPQHGQILSASLWLRTLPSLEIVRTCGPMISIYAHR